VSGIIGEIEGQPDQLVVSDVGRGACPLRSLYPLSNALSHSESSKRGAMSSMPSLDSRRNVLTASADMLTVGATMSTTTLASRTATAATGSGPLAAVVKDEIRSRLF
jgi:hypothetical protein